MFNLLRFPFSVKHQIFSFILSRFSSSYDSQSVITLLGFYSSMEPWPPQFSGDEMAASYSTPTRGTRYFDLGLYLHATLADQLSYRYASAPPHDIQYLGHANSYYFRPHGSIITRRHRKLLFEIEDLSSILCYSNRRLYYLFLLINISIWSCDYRGYSRDF